MTERLDADTVVDGRYRIVHRLGSGGMADVYCAEDLQLGRRIALKVLYRRFAEDAEFVERFRREASSAAGLQHPNVVSIYDRGEWDGTSYIAMEYIEGRTLKQLINQEAPLDPRLAGELTMQVLRAARFAHKRGVIHRDLKPHNVMVDAEGRAKVTDFGIAKAGASEMTQTGSIMGTAQYLSPEQAQGLPVSAASDLYSVGIILYELLTGRVPFEGESAVTIALKQVNEQPVPPSQLNPAVGQALDNVVLRALEKEPPRRFADADEFIDALEAAERAQPLSAVATGATAVAMAPVGPPPAPPATDEPTGTYVAAPYAYPATPLPPEPERENGGRWWVALIVGLLVAAAIVGGLLLFGGEKVTVPSVLNAQTADARIALSRLGLKVDVVDKISDAQKDTVIGQDPEAGSKVDKGDTVTITVSAGPGTAQVPDVVGDGRNAARKKLQAAGFEVDETMEASTSVRKNRVIRTSPEANQTLEKGQTVRLFVSSGPELAVVPGVVGQDVEEATRTLEDAKFEVRTREQESEDREPGTVLAQDPAANSEQPEGSRVTLTVAKEPERVAVPDVVDESADEAAETLSAAGFTVRTERTPVDDPADDGVVLSQNPSGGRRVKRGGSVTITVGRFTPAETTPTTPETPPPPPPPAEPTP
ncbi:MAG TPA: Stk1 family PASTA domain-containing Ser/Thr kinase [Solirubrobacteraceae bacterium]